MTLEPMSADKCKDCKYFRQTSNGWNWCNETMRHPHSVYGCSPKKD
jgi:hypothetical protein